MIVELNCSVKLDPEDLMKDGRTLVEGLHDFYVVKPPPAINACPSAIISDAYVDLNKVDEPKNESTPPPFESLDISEEAKKGFRELKRYIQNLPYINYKMKVDLREYLMMHSGYGIDEEDIIKRLKEEGGTQDAVDFAISFFDNYRKRLQTACLYMENNQIKATRIPNIEIIKS